MSIEYKKSGTYIPVRPRMTNSYFQINSKSFCLTYSNITKQYNGLGNQSELINLNFFDDTKPLDYIWENYSYLICSRIDVPGISIQHGIICREQHIDGNTHYHIGIQFNQSIRTRDSRLFDIECLHPNVQGARNYFQWVAYCKKDQVFYEFGSIQPSKKTIRVTPEELIELAKSLNKGEFIAYCSVHRYNYAKEIWDNANAKDECTITDLENIQGTINNCLNRLNVLWDRSKTLILVGRSGLGKTTWCKVNLEKPLLMVSHLDDLRRFRTGYHKSILFDDVSIKHLPDTSQIHICDFENPRSIHIRYGVARIPAGIVKAFTCNTIPVNIDMQAIKRRCYFVMHQELE